MAEGYYYIISALPELSLSDKSLEFNMVSYRETFLPMMQEEDAGLLRILYYKYDIQNLVGIIKEKDFYWNDAGNFSRQQLEDGIKQPELLPDFLNDFIVDHVKKRDIKKEKDLHNEASSLFIDWCRNINNPFLKRWMLFENNLKNLLIWLNSHKFDLDPTQEVLGSHFEASYLRITEKDQIDLKAWDFHFREVLTQYDNPNIAVREFLIDEMRWNFLNDIEEKFAFGVERLLGFAIRLQIINRNIMATEEDGKARLNKLLDDMRSAYVMPETF